jgi:hypothetical protein
MLLTRLPIYRRDAKRCADPFMDSECGMAIPRYAPGSARRQAKFAMDDTGRCVAT